MRTIRALLDVLPQPEADFRQRHGPEAIIKPAVSGHAIFFLVRHSKCCIRMQTRQMLSMLPFEAGKPAIERHKGK